MKKFSMGMMLSSLLLIPVGCGEEAPVVPAADPAATMEHMGHDAPATEAPATEAPATDAPATDAAP